MTNDFRQRVAEPAKRKLGCLAKIALVGLSFVVSLLLAEVIVRVFGDEVLPNPIGPRYMFVREPAIGIDLAPGFRGRFSLHGEFDVSIEINSRGFRDREFGPKADGVKRIVCLSDSFGFGFGVANEHTYAKVLESRWNESEAKPRLEVLNAGAPGRGIQHMIHVLKKCRGWFAPDVVIASFFYVNDLIDIKNFPEHTERGGIVLTKHFGTAVDESVWLSFSVHYSSLSLLAFRAYFNMKEEARGSAFRLGTQPLPARTWGLEFFKVAPGPGDQAAAARLRLMQQFEGHLVTLRRECEACGAKLVLFSIPQEPLTRDDIWQDLMRSAQLSEKDYDRDRIGKELTGSCERVGVPFLDLIPAFRSVPPKKTRFFEHNKHFNEEGHAEVARLLAEFLRARGLL